jgi:hypothetical protein
VRRVVWAASQEAVTMASHIGWSSAIGGARWSISAMPSNPAASAACALATIASIDRRIWGRKRWASIVTGGKLARSPR